MWQYVCVVEFQVFFICSRSIIRERVKDKGGNRKVVGVLGITAVTCRKESREQCMSPLSLSLSLSLSLPSFLHLQFTIPHQWMEGNLPTGSKCCVCDRACGSVRRLQDFRCLWCKLTVSLFTLGLHHYDIIPICLIGTHRVQGKDGHSVYPRGAPPLHPSSLCSPALRRHQGWNVGGKGLKIKLLSTVTIT